MSFTNLPKNLFDIYSSKEEYNGKLDSYGRFLYQFSGNRSVMKPVVSDYLVDNNLLNIDWPENRRFAACLTHDIDAIYPSLKYSLYTGTKYFSKSCLSKGLERIVSRNKREATKNPYWNFTEIVHLELKYGAKSSFYFKTTSRDPMGWIYNINDLKDEIGFLTDMEFEVGLHGGFYSHDDLNEFRKEKQALESVLGKKVIGIRMHFLRFKVPDTWQMLSELGFKYDTTFGYSDTPGFRNGMCHPFKPYDIDECKEINILEIPLTIMDASLFNMSVDKAWTINQESDRND